MSQPPDPEALFGAAALTDLGALRRAYARLLREHGPEKDPERFVVIQAAYESLRATLSAPVPGATPPSREGARSQAAWTSWVRAAADLDVILEEAGRFPDDHAAMTLRLAAGLALDPAAAADLALAELHGEEPLFVARLAFGLQPELAGAGWEAFSSDPRAQRVIGPISLARLDALCHFEEWDVAWAHWRDIGAAALKEWPQFAVNRYELLFRVQTWRRPVDEMRTERTWIHDVHHGLNDELVAAVDERLRMALEVRAAAADPRVPPPVGVAVRAVMGGDGPASGPRTLLAIMELRGGVDRAAMETLARTHPVLVAALMTPLGAISGRWARLDTEPPAVVERSDLAAAIREVDDELKASVAASYGRPVRPEQNWMMGAVIVGGALLACWITKSPFGFVALAALFRVGALNQYLVGPSVIPKSARLLPRQESLADARCLELLERHGAWTHELAIHSEGTRWVAAAAHRVAQDPWGDLFAVSLAHVRRAVWEGRQRPQSGAPA